MTTLQPPNKKPRSSAEDGGGSNLTTPDAKEIFQGILQSAEISKASNEESIPTGFHRALAKVKRDTKFLESLKDLITIQLEDQKLKEARIHQKYSRLNLLDSPLRQILVSYLNEEALWALEESTMIELEDLQLETQWGLLKMKQPQPVPARFAKSVSQDGRLFGRAASFARRMEKAAGQHYDGDSAKPSDEWPTTFFDASVEDCCSNKSKVTFFARVSLQREDGSTMQVLEGFSSCQDLNGDDRHIKLKFDKFSKESELWQLLDQYIETFEWGSDATTAEKVEKANEIGNRLAITLIAVKPNQPDHHDMELVISTTGIDTNNPGAQCVFLTPRSANPSAKTYDEATKCIRVRVGNDMVGDEYQYSKEFRIWLYTGILWVDSEEEDFDEEESDEEESDED